MKVAFIIRSLDVGGAERQLANLAIGLRAKGVSVTVGVFYHGGALEELLQGSGVSIEYLDKKSRWDLIGFIRRTRKWIRREKPDVLHGYLIEANIVAIMIKPFFRKLHVVWGVRASNVLLENYDQLARISFKLSILLSRFADLIIVNSYSGRSYHHTKGYPDERMVVIHNGIDTDLFRPDLSARQHQRSAWGIGERDFLVGIVGRIDPMKDHKTFLDAIPKVVSKNNNVRFISIGDGGDDSLKELQMYAKDLGVEKNIIWVSAQKNVEKLYNTLDVLVSTSLGEGFSNTLAEAMSCGVPCVATDVGDSARVLSSTGVIVPPGNGSAVADGILAILECDDKTCARMKLQAREHILKNFSIDQLVSSTLKVFKNRLKIDSRLAEN